MRVHLNLKFKDLIKIAIITLFCFLVYSSCHKVDAKSLNFDDDYYNYIDLTSYYDYLKTDSILSTTYQQFKTWFDSQSTYTYYYYFIDYNSSSDTSFYSDIYLFTSLQDANKFFMWVSDRYFDISSIVAYRIEINNRPISYYESVISYNSNFTFSDVQGPFSSPVDNNVIQYNTNYPIILYDSNNDFYLGSYNLSYTYMIKLGHYYYGNRDVLPSVFDLFFSTPTISFSNLTSYKDNNDNIYKYTLDVDFSIFDTSLYSYQYQTPNSSDWENITSNNSSLELQQNGSYFFRIIDNATNEIITTSSYNILDISVQAPFIKTDISTPDSCKVPYDNETLTVCKRLTLEPSYYGSDYKFQYSLDNGSTWEELFSRYSFLVSKGDIIPLRVIDNDNNVLWSDSFDFVERLDTIPNDIGILATFNDTYFGLQGSKKFYTEIYIYNLDSNLFNNVYISYDGFNWSLLDLTNYSSYFFATTRNYEQNITFYIKILDSNDDVIYTNSHYVNLNTEDVNDIVGYLEVFNRRMQGPISSVVTAPLRLINLLNTGNMCQPLQLPFAHIGNIGFPCIRQVFEQNVPEYLNLYQIISTGFIAYFCCLSLIKTIKTLVRPDDDRIEVVDL